MFKGDNPKKITSKKCGINPNNYQGSDSYAIAYLHMQMHILGFFGINAYNAYFKDFQEINAYFRGFKGKTALKIEFNQYV